jgi:hypothetical protein
MLLKGVEGKVEGVVGMSAEMVLSTIAHFFGVNTISVDCALSATKTISVDYAIKYP